MSIKKRQRNKIIIVDELHIFLGRGKREKKIV